MPINVRYKAFRRKSFNIKLESCMSNECIKTGLICCFNVCKIAWELPKMFHKWKGDKHGPLSKQLHKDKISSILNA